jgi:hypothetical protein
MRFSEKFLLIALFLTLFACKSQDKIVQTPTLPQLNLDLNKPEDNLTAFAKMRCSTKEGEETYFYATGTIYSFIPGERDKAILDFEMYNVAKLLKIEGGYQMLTREVGFYKDLETGKILEKWYNPWRKDTIDVVQVWNDPVNQKFILKGKYGDWGVPFTENAGRVAMYSDIFLTYPSPLSVADFPENSASDTYEAAELFQFFFNKADVNNPNMANVPCDMSWTRMAPYLPWMRMGQRPGNLVYQCRGYKLSGADAWLQIPQQMREYILKNKPEFQHAPDVFVAPNETSWTYFKKLKKKG